MDALTENIIWGVVWLFAGSIGAALIYFLFLAGGMFVSLLSRKEWPMVLFIPLGWIAAVAWEIFVVVQVVIHAINIFKLV